MEQRSTLKRKAADMEKDGVDIAQLLSEMFVSDSNDALKTDAALDALVAETRSKLSDPLLGPVKLEESLALETTCQPAKKYRDELGRSSERQELSSTVPASTPTPRGPKPPRPRRKAALLKKIQKGEAHKADTVTSCANMAKPLATSTGWSGLDFRKRPDAEFIKKLWQDGSIVPVMLKDLSFNKVPFIGRGTIFVDGLGRAFAFRSAKAPMCAMPLDKEGRTYMQVFGDECIFYIRACGDRSEDDIDGNSRGDHWYMIIGVDRQNKPRPELTLFHRMHMEATEKLLEKGTATARLIEFASDVFRTRFPSLAQRVVDCEERLRRLGYGEHAKPLFGCFYSYCINGPRPEAHVLGVSTEPHVDGKNLALMMCAVFVYGEFDHTEKAWLVLWEAGLIIEIPPGVLMLYPSSLFTHFNVDVTALEIVTTADGSRPTRDTAIPCRGVKGRGSVVLFNQATMFQLSETGYTVKEARARGVPTGCDNTEHIANLPKPSID